MRSIFEVVYKRHNGGVKIQYFDSMTEAMNYIGRIVAENGGMENWCKDENGLRSKDNETIVMYCRDSQETIVGTMQVITECYISLDSLRAIDGIGAYVKL